MLVCLKLLSMVDDVVMGEDVWLWYFGETVIDWSVSGGLAMVVLAFELGEGEMFGEAI